MMLIKEIRFGVRTFFMYSRTKRLLTSDFILLETIQLLTETSFLVLLVTLKIFTIHRWLNETKFGGCHSTR